ncbi:unnamed protein product [Sphagnum balticum]
MYRMRCVHVPIARAGAGGRTVIAHRLQRHLTSLMQCTVSVPDVVSRVQMASRLDPRCYLDPLNQNLPAEVRCIISSTVLARYSQIDTRCAMPLATSPNVGDIVECYRICCMNAERDGHHTTSCPIIPSSTSLTTSLREMNRPTPLIDSQSNRWKLLFSPGSRGNVQRVCVVSLIHEWNTADCPSPQPTHTAPGRVHVAAAGTAVRAVDTKW